jgi:uncharacterized protein (DUF2235 family)
MVRKVSPCVIYDVCSLVFTNITFTINRNFKQIVLAAYGWLSENFQEGDLIYIFGMLLVPVVVRQRLIMAQVSLVERIRHVC